jgi:hypothetical protein
VTQRLQPHQIDPLGAADGTYGLVVAGGKVTGVHGVVSSRYLPLTTSINGVPELVWDADNKLVFTEVPA